MPNLPTVTVTDAQAARILAVFGDVATYKNWLVEQIRSHVITSELNNLDATHVQVRIAKLEEINAELPAPTPPPVTEPVPPPVSPPPA